MAASSTSGHVDADRIGFFFGAGSSTQFGIPSMRRITSTFAETVGRKRAFKKQKIVFNAVFNSLAKIYGKDNIDLEAIMTVIVGLREKEHFKENIGDLGLYILQKNEVTGYGEQFKYNKNILDSLEKEFKSHIRKSVVIRNPKKIDLMRQVYCDFFKQICSITNCANKNHPPSDPYKDTHDGWTFFTTNYDNALEDFWVRWREYPKLYLGFGEGKKTMNADKFLYNNTGYLHTSAMQLVKLHGSVNWIKNRNKEIQELSYHLNLDDIKSKSGSKDIETDIIIYPLSQKQLYFTPFTQLFGILNSDLTKRDFWIIIGYSFRDIIIRTMFERALLEDRKRKLILVHPHATEEIRPLFQEHLRDHIACLDRYFARRNYASVNEEITKVLLRLASA